MKKKPYRVKPKEITNHRQDQSLQGCPPQSRVVPFIAIGVLSIYGAAVSLYLLVSHYSQMAGMSDASACNFGGWLDCDAVNTSVSSEISGIPISYFGVVFYVFFASLATWAAALPPRRNGLAVPFVLFSVIGIIESAYLAYVSLFSIRAFCIFCISLYAVNIALLVLSLRISRSSGKLARSKHGTGDFVKRNLGWTMAVIFVLLGGAHLRQKSTSLKSNIVENIAERINSGSTTVGAIPGQAFGKLDASLSVLLFSDFECSHCKRAAPVFQQLIDMYGDRVRFVYKHFPLDSSCNPAISTKGHKNACKAALVSVCAAIEGKFDVFHTEIFKHGADIEKLTRAAEVSGLNGDSLLRCSESITSSAQLKGDTLDGIRLGVKSTPTFVIGDRIFRGTRDIEILSRAIDDELNMRQKNPETGTVSAR